MIADLAQLLYVSCKALNLTHSAGCGVKGTRLSDCAHAATKEPEYARVLVLDRPAEREDRQPRHHLI